MTDQFSHARIVTRLNPARRSADATSMSPLPAGTWIVAGAITFIAVISILKTLAAAVQEQTAAEELRQRVRTLRRQYAKRIAEMRSGEEIIEVDVVENEPAAAPLKNAA